MLKTKKLNKFYRRFGKKPLHVINNTSLQIPETGIIAVIGASGAGKTTLINTISGLDSFKSGSIAFDDVKMTRYNTHVADRLRMKNYGFIFQNYYLLENETVYENVKVSLDAFNLSEAEKKKRVTYVLNQLGIGKYTYKSVSNLSGGEQQRVSIARALVKSPRIIFADEPTGSLDEKTTFNVLNILKKISKTCAVFIVTHEREIISYYADYILELDDGVVVKEFTPEVAPGKRLAIDKNIYLSELDHVENYNKDDLTLDIYSDHSKPENKSQIKIAIKDDKIYLESSADIKVFSKDSENHFVEGKPKEIKDYVNDDFEYDLPKLDYADNRISLKKTLSRGYKNYKSKRPIKNLFKVVCVLLSVVLMSLLQEYNTIVNTDLSGTLTASSGNLYVELLPDANDMTLSKMRIATETLVEEVENSPLDVEVLYDARDTLVYQYNGFYQIQSKVFALPAHDYKNINGFDEESLVYGHMPTSNYEIVVDEYILEKFVNSTLLKTVVTDYGHFVDKKLQSNYTGIEFTISGICRTKSPTIYGHISVNFARLSYDTRARIIDIDYAKEIYPEMFAGVVVPESHYYIHPSYIVKDYLNTTLIRDGVLSEDIPFDYVVNKADYSLIKKVVCNEANYIYLSTDGRNESIRNANKLIEDVKKKLAENDIHVKINVTNRYQEQYDKAMATPKNIMLILEIVAIIAIIVAIVSIAISTYLSMLSQITDIAVYRSLGYSRLNLGFTYFIELLLISLKYIAIGGAITFLTMFFMDIIPLIDFVLITPFWQFLAVLGIALVFILFIGLLPIFFVFKKTPANLYNRFAKRTNEQVFIILSFI